MVRPLTTKMLQPDASATWPLASSISTSSAPAYAGILKGVTRDVIIDLAREAGFDVQETLLNRYDVYTADEVFFTGTAAEVVGIREVDGRRIGAGKPGPITHDIAARFRALTRA